MELWDIYDKNKKLTGRTMVRNDWNMAPGDYHLTVLGVIQRPDGKYLISQRKMDKAWGAGWWEIPGGGVQAGETGEQSVRREAHEETGLNVTDVPCELVYTYERVNPEEKNNYFVDIYRFVLDFDESDVHVQESEVEDFRIATAEEIAELGAKGVFLHYDSMKQVFEQG